MTSEIKIKQPEKKKGGNSQTQEQKQPGNNWLYRSGIFGTPEWKDRVRAEATSKFLKSLSGDK